MLVFVEKIGVVAFAFGELVEVDVLVPGGDEEAVGGVGGEDEGGDGVGGGLGEFKLCCCFITLLIYTRIIDDV